MPSVRSLAFKCLAYCFKLIVVILLLSEIIPSYSCYIEKGLICITIIALSSCQPSSYSKYIKLNIYSSCNIYFIFNAKCIYLTIYLCIF
jgi:hypothetical protein